MLTFLQFQKAAEQMALREGMPALAAEIVANGRSFDLVLAVDDNVLEQATSLKLVELMLAFQDLIRQHRGCELLELDEDLFLGRTLGQVYEELCRRYGNPPRPAPHPEAA